MKMRKEIHNDYKDNISLYDDMIARFDSEGDEFGNQDRNTLKLFDCKGMTVNIKSFKIPNIFNQIAYRFFRKSKAQRSFEYANKLTELGIGTPQPLGYYEFTTPLFFKRSFYLSEHQDYDLTYRELTHQRDYPDHENILRAFTRFTYKLHEQQVHFLDHSPGNTLIKKIDNGYNFYLVDLNRMQFGALDFETRIRNFSRLTIHKDMIATMSDEYARCSGEDYETIFNLMWRSTVAFQEKFHRKKRLKKKLKFWK